MAHSKRTSYHAQHSNLDVAKGEVIGEQYVEKFGRNTLVASGAKEVIWDQADAVYTYMATASTLYVSSSHTDDDETFEVQGLDEHWNLKTQNVVCNGLVFVSITGTWTRVFRVKNISATTPQGDIYISDDNTDVGGDGIPDTATNIKAKIIQGDNQTNMAIYTIPKGYTGYLVSWYASMLRSTGVTATAADVNIWRREYGGVFRSTHPGGIQNTGTGGLYYTFPFPLSLSEKTDIEVTAQPTANADVSAGFTIHLIKN